MSIPPSVWIHFATIPILTAFVGLCLGVPGRSQIKLTLVRICIWWPILPALDAIIFVFDHNGQQPPTFVLIALVIAFQIFIAMAVDLFYAIAEKKTGLHFKLTVLSCAVGCVLTPFFEVLYSLDGKGRILLPALSLFIGNLGCLWYLFQAYRVSAKNSTRRKRIQLIFMNGMWSCMGVYFPWVIAESTGWLTNAALGNGLMHFLIILPTCIVFSFVIQRYNLVKVQLDQVGEGLFRDIDSPVLLLSKEQNILRVNPKAEETFIFDAAKEEGKDFAISSFIADFNKNASNFDTTLNTKSGLREYECTLSNVYQMDEVLGSIVVFHDVTKERELARMKTEFTSTVSHELRTPLTSILGFAKLIDKRFQDVILPKWNSETKKEQRAVKQINKNLGVIISESNRLTTLINDVLDISKMEAGKVDWNFSTCRAQDIIEQAINATTGLFQAKPVLELIQKIPAELPDVVADSDRVVQVIINLISNAVKFTDSGSITIQVEKEWSSICIKVIDTGDGISPENQKLVFEKYKQVGDVITDKPTGTGLGLPISKEIVENHGGRIWVESKIGEGSTFGFTLPLANVIDNHLPNIHIDDMVSQLDKLDDRPRSSDEPTILVIDDESAIREVLRQMLEEHNYAVIEAADGMEGLSVIRQEKPDLIVLDVMMPKLNGFDCAAAIKSDPELRHIPIMMLTVVENAQRAYGLGVEAYLTKPFSPEHVMEEIARLLEKRAAQRRVVLLGQADESLAVWKKLQENRTACLQVENITDLEQALQQVPDLAIVVGENFQEIDKRLEIQRLVGSKSCLVLYIDPNKI